MADESWRSSTLTFSPEDSQQETTLFLLLTECDPSTIFIPEVLPPKFLSADLQPSAFQRGVERVADICFFKDECEKSATDCRPLITKDRPFSVESSEALSFLIRVQSAHLRELLSEVMESLGAPLRPTYLLESLCGLF